MSVRSKRSTLAALSGVLLLSLLGTACSSGGSGEDKPEKKDAKPPALKQLWAMDADSVGAVWQHEDTVAVAHGEALTGHAADSGRKKWELPLPEGASGVCLAGEQVNADGFGVVLLERKGDCDLLVRVDIRDGSLGWRKPLKTHHSGSSTRAKLSIDKVVTVGGMCRELEQFAVKDGARLPNPAKRGKDCFTALHDGSVLAVQHAPERSRQAGDGYRVDLEAYEADTGKKLWQRTVDGEDSTVRQIVASDPLTLATREGDTSNIRSYDSQGKPTPVVDSSAGEIGAIAAVGDGVLVLSQKGRWRAYDLREGKELWTRKKRGHFTPKIVQRDSLVSVRSIDDPAARDSTWVTRHDLRDPDKQQMLGTIDGPMVQLASWDAKRLYVMNEDQFEVYALPAKGKPFSRQGTPNPE